METNLKKIIDISIYAPSGDNSQPWRFKIINNTILVYNIPEKDISLYNFNMSASLIAIGALIENIKIAASHFGYDCKIKINDNLTDNLIAECSFSENTVTEDPLFVYIKERKTNRKPYKKDSIDLEILNKIHNYKPFSNLDSVLITEKESISKIAKACSINEQVVLENEKLHNFLFNHITWTEKEDSIKRGFYIKTLELRGPQILVFKLLRSWKINKFLNKIGISKFVAKENALIYEKTGAILAITSTSLSHVSFLETGMLVQRLWLIATKHRLYMQPLTGVIFLNHRINNKDNLESFSQEHKDLIRKSYKTIEQLTKSENKYITTMFRMGYAEEPSAETKRLEAEIEL